MSDGRAIDEEIGVLVKGVQSVLHQRMDEALNPLGLSVPQYVCLQHLHDSPGITSSELARRVFVSRQSMNVLLVGLEKRGLVERSHEPAPRRERATVLTEQAAVLVLQAREQVAKVVARMTSGWEDARRREFRDALALCRDTLIAFER